MSQHTPTPWMRGSIQKESGITVHWIGSAPKVIAEVSDFDASDGATVSFQQAEAEANAAFIVRACNAYEGLISDLKNIAMDLEDLKEDAQSSSVRIRAAASLKCIKAAIAKAEGR